MQGKLLLAAAALALAGTSAVVAQGTDPIAQRQALMKQNGKDTKAGAAMAKGEAPFDAAKAAAIFADMHDVSLKFGNYFPPNSKTGGKTEAAPAIWDKPADFKAALAKFQADTQAAVDAKPATLDAFRAQFGKVTQNCKSCHETFKQKDS